MLYEIDGRGVADKDLQAVFGLMGGAEGSEVTLLLGRPSLTPSGPISKFKVVVVRQDGSKYLRPTRSQDAHPIAVPAYLPLA
jgi:C-terminal processing protease CtpA/Prc